ncbi:AfsR/SARP family transcriptional regulator [Streptomyces sp. NPDC003032]
MRFGVLGPLAVWDGEGELVKVPEAKVRALLADLLVYEGRPVSADRLIDDLWGDEPPGNPANALQSKVSQLRRAIGRDRVVRQAPGYRLRVDAGAGDEVDAFRFLDLVGGARREDDPGVRAELLTSALQLWRGPAYADFADEAFVRGAARRLGEQRLAVLEEQAEARLASGDRTLLTGELADLVARHPLRERLRGVQMRALYLAGRQSEALASYAGLRERLARELGVDPGPELSALHEAILRQDTVLDGVAPWSAASRRVSPTHPPVSSQPTPGRRSEDLAPGPDAASPRPSPRRTHQDPEPGPAAGSPQPTPRPDAQGPTPGAAADSPQSTPGPASQDPAAGPSAVSPQSSSRTGSDGSGSDGSGSDGSGLPRTNLPAPLTPLIGREHAVGEVRGLLGGARLVTLTGSGGVGKTRLAVEAAAGMEAEADYGVWLVEFAGQHGDSDVADLAQAVAGALGLRDDVPSGLPGPGSGSGPGSATGSATGSVERLAAALREHRTLLVLDNCEQVVEQAAALADALLRAAPGLRVLATSQEPLGLTGEAVFLVEPLDADDAVGLFAARAAASAPGFTLADPGDAEAVAEICRRLDGIPLALELAATRVRTLGVKELAARLGDRFRLLTSGQRGAPARQQTLRAVIDWSWELLSAPERIVLRRLAVHRDGCTLEAAEAVCAGDGVAREDVLDLLTRLVDRSLVVVAAMAPGRVGAGAGAGAATRYRLLESVAAYAVERLLEMEDLTGVRERHLRHYLALAERAEPRLRDGGQRVWLGRLDAEAANLRAALEEAVRGDSPREAVRLAGALAWWWLLRGRLTEALRSLSAVLGLGSGSECLGSAEWGELRVLRVLRGAFGLLTGEVVERAVPRGRGGVIGPVRSCGCDVAERAVPRAPGEALGSAPTCGYDVAERAVPRAPDRATGPAPTCGCAVAERAVPRAPGRVAPGGVVPDAVVSPDGRLGAGGAVHHLWLYAYGLFSAGHQEESERVNTRVIALAGAAGDQWSTAAALGLRAMHALIRGDLDAVGRDGARGAELFAGLGDRWGELQAITPLAVLAEIRGEYAEAARRQDEGLRIARELGLEAEVAARLSGLGRLALLTRDWERARELHEEARRLAAAQGYRYGEIHAEMGLALGARRSGDLAAAESYLLRIRDRHADVSSPAGDHLLHAELGFLAELRGDGARAESEHLRGLEIARGLAEPRALALSLEGLAGAAALPGDPAGAERAALLLGTADAARRSVGAPLPAAERGDVDRIAASAKAALGDAAFAEAFERGTKLPPLHEFHELR